MTFWQIFYLLLWLYFKSGFSIFLTVMHLHFKEYSVLRDIVFGFMTQMYSPHRRNLRQTQLTTHQSPSWWTREFPLGLRTGVWRTESLPWGCWQECGGQFTNWLLWWLQSSYIIEESIPIKVKLPEAVTWSCLQSLKDRQEILTAA